MMAPRFRFLCFWLLATGPLVLTGCDALFGSKGDATTEEIFEQGQTDPTLTDDVGYVLDG